jgi:RNA polymerase sigma-70 factor (ECF subfamily)
MIILEKGKIILVIFLGKLMKVRREDMELINSILSNTKEKLSAENELYGRYYRVAYNKVRKYNYDIESAKDIATDIMLKVFGSLELYDKQKCSFNSWVIKIASNHLIDIFRKNKNKIKFVSYSGTMPANFENTESFTCTTTPTFASGIVSLNYVTTSTNQEDSLIYKEDYTNALNALTESESRIFKLKYEYGYSNSEIGNMYEVSKAVVSNKINYLKKKIQKNLGE